MHLPPLLRMALLCAALGGALSALAEPLTFHTRRREPDQQDPQRWAAVERTATWDSTRTAVVICDMWDQHHCPDATERVGEMVPRVNEFIKAARSRGVFIIHCPSDTMGFYKDHPGRRLAQAAPKVPTKTPLQGWCPISSGQEPPLPIDDSDGGCDGCPDCPSYTAWSRQHPAIEIQPGDAITDSVEAYYLMRQREITNVIVLGVHANMCVLGRPFSIRQLVSQGLNVLLMRDLTDSMYNHRKAPFVNHFQGTELVVEHIEKFWCPSATSADLLGGKPFRFGADEPRTVAFLIGEDEYQTDHTLPAFARDNLEWRGIRTRFYQEKPGAPGDFGNLDDLASADALVISVRRRNPPADQMRRIREYVASGKPVIGIRTATHAFTLRNTDNPPDRSWLDFDTTVFGAHYEDHYGTGKTTTVAVPAASKDLPLVAGIHGSFGVQSHLYRSHNPASTVTVLLTGTTDDGKSEVEPVAWINNAAGRVFYTSLGAPSDFALPDFRRLLLNGILWGLNDFIPPAAASLDEPNRTPTPPAGAPASAPKRADTTPAPGPVTPSVNAGQAGASKQSGPLSPADSLRAFRPAPGLAVDLLLSEPEIAQPLQIQFDQRGRLWVVEYRQYPNPAGLKVVSHDNFWRAVYDKIPAPPPNHVRGLDRVTIHEDHDGDGRFTTHKTFLDGLNIATSVALAADGVYVMNPPYLLFYPDADHDDVPDGPPQVLLSGFGLEDTHSVANSLRWGPDGWLYGCQGSTVTGNIRVHGPDGQPLPGPVAFSQGQNIWRYHPPTRRYEIFAEGGGNAFGLEIDAAGRIFSGHNGGDTRGFHYQQGAYLQKGFEKHGPLSNPYAFGYFPPMAHNQAERFTHTFIVNEADGLGPEHRGRLFGAEPLQGRIVEAELTPVGTTFRTRDLGFALTSADTWFRPVDIKLGPDGALYIADWYDRQVTHIHNEEGQIDPSNGRVYRLRAATQPPGPAAAALAELRSLPSGAAMDDVEAAVLRALANPNRIVRQLGLRWVADHASPELGSRLARRLIDREGTPAARPPAVELLWAAQAAGDFDGVLALLTLAHPDPLVRAWTIRLLGDRPALPADLARRLADTARREPSPEVRSQLASTARRLPARDGLPIVDALLRREADASDARQPLQLWWALESWCGADRDLVVARFKDRGLWAAAIVQKTILNRLGRRFAAAATKEDWAACAQLFRECPDPASARQLLAGFEQAFEGRPIPELPGDLVAAMSQAGASSLWLSASRGDAAAVEQALKVAADANASLNDRVSLLGVLAARQSPGALPILLRLATEPSPEALRHAALAGLGRFADPSIGPAITAALGSMRPAELPAALGLLTSRAGFAAALLDGVTSGAVAKEQLDANTVRRIRALRDPALDTRATALWPNIRQATSGELEDQVKGVLATLDAGPADPYSGKKLFTATCAPCHKLFGLGASIGPDLTSYLRSDVRSMALNIVAPNAEIREGYETFNVETKDGRSLSGFLAEQDPGRIVLRGLDGENTVLDRKELVSLTPAGVSLMPEGLLTALSGQQVRDLFAYLRSTQPLNEPK